MEPRELNLVWRLPVLGCCLLVLLILVGFSPIPVAAQEAVVTAQQLYQRPEQSSIPAGEERVQPDATRSSKETTMTEPPGSTYKYSGLPGKFIKSGVHSRSQGRLMADREPKRHYSFEFAATGIPKGSNPTEAYWFERKDGTLMLVDPLISQKYSGNPR